MDSGPPPGGPGHACRTTTGADRRDNKEKVGCSNSAIGNGAPRHSASSTRPDRRPPASGRQRRTFDAIDPASNRLLARVAACDAADVDAAVAAARRAFDEGPWARLAPVERKRVLLRLAELMLAHREELALLDSLNMGKPVMDAWNIDVPGAAHVFAWYAESLDKLYDQVAPTAQQALATITRVPLG